MTSSSVLLCVSLRWARLLMGGISRQSLPRMLHIVSQLQREGRNMLSILSLHSTSCSYDSIATVCLSAVLLWGMSLFSVAAKWSIKWGEQTVSVSAARHRSLLIAHLFYLNFLSTSLIVSLAHLKSTLQTQKDHVYIIHSSRSLIRVCKSTTWRIPVTTILQFVSFTEGSRREFEVFTHFGV